jgi:hypothetical protein
MGELGLHVGLPKGVRLEIDQIRDRLNVHQADDPR